MSLKTIYVFYWTAFTLAVGVMVLNIGLGLIALGIIILPVLILHGIVGLRLGKMENHKASIILSASNLLAFALVRPDGVHTLAGNGLSSILDVLGVNAGYNPRYDNYFLVTSLILMLVQVIMDIRLLRTELPNQ